MTLYWEMITPPLKAGKKYPVFFEHYGGPASQQVQRAWMHPMAPILGQQGLDLFPGRQPRLAQPRHAPSRTRSIMRWARSRSQDQATAARWLQKQPYVDPGKIATYGWSYGGYMSLKMLEKAPNGLYAAGVVGAPVTNGSCTTPTTPSVISAIRRSTRSRTNRRTRSALR